jgi:hypothetical protein
VRAAAAPKSTVGKAPPTATGPKPNVDLTKPVGPVAKAEKPLKIVFVSTEVAPWSKTGGLGDVVGSLPEELVKRGHKVRHRPPSRQSDLPRCRFEGSATNTLLPPSHAAIASPPTRSYFPRPLVAPAALST